MIKINGFDLETITFPNGEVGYKKHSFRGAGAIGPYRVDYKFEGNADLMDLFFVLEELRSKNEETMIYLRIGYMPYSRMDRDNDDFTFTLQRLSTMLRRIPGLDISVVEPHSDVTARELELYKMDRYSETFMTPGLVTSLMMDRGLNVKNTLLVFPDAGAAKRYPDIINRMPMSPIARMRTLSIAKIRDFTTGNIKEIKIANNQDTDDLPKTAIIIDDLCSKGGTFLGAAAALKEAGVEVVYLVVAHAEKAILDGGICSSDLIEEVYTTNTIISKEDVCLTKIKIFNLG